MEEQGRKLGATTNPRITENESRNFQYTPNLPSDLVEEILQKLPVKSLVRFKSVSKQWRSTIKSQGFVERHLIHQKSRDPKILVSSDLRTIAFFSPTKTVSLATLSIGPDSVEDDEEICSSYTLSDRFCSTTRVVLVSCDGLVCFYDATSIYVINPATRELRKIPPPSLQLRSDGSKPSVIRDVLVGFGRDNVTGTYKVVWLYSLQVYRSESYNRILDPNRHTKCEVFALDIGAWRYINPPLYQVFSKLDMVYINGSLYWFTEQFCEPCERVRIVAFDLHTEKFHAVPNPPGFAYKDYDQIELYSLKNRLCMCLVSSNVLLDIWGMNPEALLDIWGLDLDERWERMYSIRLNEIPWDVGFIVEVRPLAACNNRDIVISDFADRLLIYFPTKGSFHLVSMPGCVLGHYREGNVVTSYFESLVSAYE